MSVFTLNSGMSSPQSAHSYLSRGKKYQLIFILEINCNQILSLNSVYNWRTPENQTWDCEFQLQYKSGSKHNRDRRPLNSDNTKIGEQGNDKWAAGRRHGCKPIVLFDRPCKIFFSLCCFCITAPPHFILISLSLLAALSGLTNEVD